MVLSSDHLSPASNNRCHYHTNAEKVHYGKLLHSEGGVINKL